MALGRRKVEGKEEREIYSSSFARQNFPKLHEGTDFFFLKRLGVDSCRTNSVKRLKGFQELSMIKAKPKDWTLETLMTRLRPYFNSIFFNGRLENTG